MKVLLYTLLISAISFSPGMAQDKNISSNTERIFLHTDRNIYIAGDDLFYCLYLQGNPGQMSKYAYLVLRNRYNQTVIQVRVDIRNRMAFGNIYLPDTLRTDVYQIVCYTNYMRNKGEDSFFTKEIVIANRFDKKLDLADSTFTIIQSTALPVQQYVKKEENGNLIINLDNNNFSTREKVIFSLETKNIPGDAITRLSVSVSEIVPGMSDEQSISDTLWPVKDHSIYHMEVKGSVIEGRVVPLIQSGNQPVSSTIFVSTPDSIANMQYTMTDSLGAFCIFLNNYYEGKELIIRLKENVKANIVPGDKFKLNKPFIPSKIFRITDIRSYLVRSRNISEVQRYYNEKSEISILKADEKVLSIPGVYYKPDSRIFPADYLTLPDFVEISRELLPGMKVRKNNDEYILSYSISRNNSILTLEPQIFLDGVPINDVNQIINLGTNQIKQIDILPVIRYYGEIQLPGILAVFSRNLEINNIQFKTPTIRYQALISRNLTKPKQFIPADTNNQIPDLRQLLYWEPEIILNNNEKVQIEFYTSDLRGKYLINIQGITSGGHPVSGSSTITVKSK